jgi:hypothetical protein
VYRATQLPFWNRIREIKAAAPSPHVYALLPSHKTPDSSCGRARLLVHIDDGRTNGGFIDDDQGRGAPVSLHAVVVHPRVHAHSLVCSLAYVSYADRVDVQSPPPRVYSKFPSPPPPQQTPENGCVQPNPRFSGCDSRRWCLPVHLSAALNPALPVRSSTRPERRLCRARARRRTGRRRTGAAVDSRGGMPDAAPSPPLVSPVSHAAARQGEATPARKTIYASPPLAPSWPPSSLASPAWADDEARSTVPITYIARPAVSCGGGKTRDRKFPARVVDGRVAAAPERAPPTRARARCVVGP